MNVLTTKAHQIVLKTRTPSSGPEPVDLKTTRFASGSAMVPD